jgi:hypothetical protein
MILTMSVPLNAQEVKRSEADIARRLQNPLTNFNLLGLSWQTGSSSNLDRFSQRQSGLPMQKMLPFSLGPSLNVISQNISPLHKSTKVADSFGVRNLSISALVTPADAPTITWGLGPALSFPNTNISGNSGRWGTGISGAVVYSVKAWVGGVFISNMWSFEGISDGRSVNEIVVQPFLSYNLSKGWYLTSAPAISVNWQADSGNAWTVPIGGGVGKVVSVYGQMLNVTAQGYVYPVHPTPGTGWAVQTTLQWLFPK